MPFPVCVSDNLLIHCPNIQRDDKNTTTKSKILELGRKATIVTADLASDTEVASLAERVLSEKHDVDILVTCAGIQRRHPSHIFPKSDWDEVNETNLSPSFCAKSAFPGAASQSFHRFHAL